MPQQILEIQNKLGMHARAVAQFVKTASRFKSTVTVEKEGVRVNGKSIMGVLMLAAAQGSRIRVSTEGEDADAALAALKDLVAGKFGEDE